MKRPGPDTERTLQSLLLQVGDNRLTVYASSGAFYLFIALFPTAALLCSILPMTMLTRQQVQDFLSALLPTVMQTLLNDILTDVYGSGRATVPISALLLAWSAGKAAVGLSRGLDHVYCGRQERSFLRLRLLGSLTSLGLLFFILLSLSVNLMQRSLLARIVRLWPAVGGTVAFLLRLRFPAAMLMLALLFALLYRFLPSGTRSLNHQIPGALLASLLWMLLSWLMPLFLERFGAGSVYGSLATVALAMIWIFWCMEIVLLGAGFNVWLFPGEKPGA